MDDDLFTANCPSCLHPLMTGETGNVAFPTCTGCGYTTDPVEISDDLFRYADNGIPELDRSLSHHQHPPTSA